MLGSAIKMFLGIPASHVEVLGFDRWLHYQFPFPADVNPGKQQVIWVLAIQLGESD